MKRLLACFLALGAGVGCGREGELEEPVPLYG